MPAKQAENLKFTVPVEYYRVQHGPEGPSEIQVSGNLKFWKLSRRNASHAAFVMDMQQGRKDPLEMALQFVKTFCAEDDSVREDLLGDGLACVAAMASKEVADELNVFFDKWELTKRVPDSNLQNNG